LFAKVTATFGLRQLACPAMVPPGNAGMWFCTSAARDRFPEKRGGIAITLNDNFEHRAADH